MARPIVALLTDFGTRDHYAGTMKGVVAGVCPDANARRHHPRDSAARRPDAPRSSSPRAYRYFPPGTIFLVVVDPGVGSARRGLVGRGRRLPVRRAGQRRADAVFRDHKPKRVVELTERRYARPTVSRTFEGRDRFAPAAAWLARGTELDGARPPGDGLADASTCLSRRSESSQIRGEVVLRRSLRQPRDATSTGGCSISSGMTAPFASPWTGSASTVSSRPMPRRRPAASARCSAVRSTSSWR